ncbi:hypothetical protein [Paenibacillus caui]|uniref:hypothetical protein n=1 Tax=Paenibacillus caui TaxID=2873927 RepID=UPI001CA804CA|nr:hypothetical protein [Paenibacillus caui]
MQTQYINEMLNLPELKVSQILSIDTDELHIDAQPISHKQCCPVCQSDVRVTRKGSNDMRVVRPATIALKPFSVAITSLEIATVTKQAF